jgi:uncharacterized membrane protein YraQ (UPF0718 family)
MDFIVPLFSQAFGRTLISLSHNWPYLLFGITVAGVLKAFVDADRVAAFLNRSKRLGVLSATAAAVATPLCSCGTTAVVLGMMAGTMPWAPIVAFMVASPLSSPEGIVYSAGLFGRPFAFYYFGASILLGLAGGAAAALLQKAGFLEGQLRFAAPDVPSQPCGCSAAAAALPIPASAQPCGCSSSPSAPAAAAPQPYSAAASRARELAAAMREVSKTLVPLFVAFAFLGYLLNGLIPASAIAALFGSGRAYGVPLAATIGLPLYINAEASVPLARGLLESGMSPGAIMAFLIAGSGTSFGAIGGALTIARWKIVALVVAVLWTGAIAVGWSYNALLAAGLI